MIFLCLILVFALKSYGTVGEVSTNDSKVIDNEFMLKTMDFLEYKFQELRMEVKEQIESVLVNQERSERAILKLTRDILMQRSDNSEFVEFLNKKKYLVAPEKITSVKSCESELSKSSGKYLLTLTNSTEFPIYCEQTLHGGGWIVIQNRFDGSVDFYRNWTEYKNGFGSLDGEFWLGLDKIHMLTSNKTMQLLVYLEDFLKHKKFAVYSEFAIGDESEKYALKGIGGHTGNLVDSLLSQKGSKFSTFDVDNDRSFVNCAAVRRGAWWYNKNCSQSNLNGPYMDEEEPVTMNWFAFSKKYLGLKISKMMIK